jgi:hypothetical protein
MRRIGRAGDDSAPRHPASLSFASCELEQTGRQPNWFCQLSCLCVDHGADWRASRLSRVETGDESWRFKEPRLNSCPRNPRQSLHRWVHRELPRATTSASRRALRSARVPHMYYRHKPYPRGPFWMPIGVRPCGWTDSSGSFDRLLGVLILKLHGAEITQGRMQPF